jgi:hypothetical protein
MLPPNATSPTNASEIPTSPLVIPTARVRKIAEIAR